MPTLNLIFHGSFEFNRVKRRKRLKAENGRVSAEIVEVEDEEGIEVLIPKFPEHVFRAGNWLGETELIGHDHPLFAGHHHPNAAAVYELNGIEPGDQWLSPDHNLVTRSSNLPREDRLHAKLLLPLPRGVATPRGVRVPVSSLSDKDGNRIAKEELLKRIINLGEDSSEVAIGTVQVFTYEFEDDAALRLDSCRGHGHYWEPAFGEKTINLHIFSAHERNFRVSEADAAFNACCDLLDVDLKLSVATPPTPRKDSKPPEGVIAEELEDLAPRTQRLGQLGRMKNEGRHLELLWFEREVFDPSPSSCGGTGNCRGCP